MSVVFHMCSLVSAAPSCCSCHQCSLVAVSGLRAQNPGLGARGPVAAPPPRQDFFSVETSDQTNPGPITVSPRLRFPIGFRFSHTQTCETGERVGSLVVGHMVGVAALDRSGLSMLA